MSTLDSLPVADFTQRMVIKKRATAASVAKACGVSPSTVSLILNGQGDRFNHATRENVLRLAEESGLLANFRSKKASIPAGKSLKSGLLLGFIYPQRDGVDHGFHLPYIYRVYQGLEAAARETNQLLIPIPVGHEPGQEQVVPDMLKRHEIDGVVVMGECVPGKVLPYILSKKIPSVVVDNWYVGGGLAHVRIDNIQGACSAALHLLGNYPNVGMVMPVQHSDDKDLGKRSDIQERTEGVLLAFAKTGKTWDPENFAPLDYTKSIDDGLASILSLLKRIKKPSGIVCFDDYTAHGVMLKCIELGLNIPNDIGVVGFSDIQSLTEIVTPKMSSVQVPWEKIGAEAFRLISNTGGSQKACLGTSLVPVELVVRESSVPQAPKMVRKKSLAKG